MLTMALPCRISVYTEDNHIPIGMIRPEGMVHVLSGDGELQSIATEVECTMGEMIQLASHCSSSAAAGGGRGRRWSMVGELNRFHGHQNQSGHPRQH